MELTARTDSHPDEVASTAREGALRPASRVRMYTDAWTEVDLFRREDLSAGDVIAGPAVIAEANATTVVDPGWQARVTDHSHLLLRRVEARPRRPRRPPPTWIPVMLELFNNLFMSIAEQMGERLRATANSVNIKERLDFSCALFDTDGHLIANAPHMPVHLGSMGESIKAVIEANAGRMRPGRLLRPQQPVPRGHPPARHHRGDPGLRRDASTSCSTSPLAATTPRSVASHPGSMPSFSRRVEEEGVLIDNALLTRDGRMREAEMLAPADRGEFPARNPAGQPGGPAGAAGRQREGRLRAPRPGRGLRPGRRDGLHGARAGQRRRGGAPRHLRAARRELPLRARLRSRHRGHDHRRPRTAVGPHRLHRYVGAATGQLQRPRPRSPWPRSSTCSARWSTTRSRSTPAASSRSR